jgi:hypothetical protein
MPEANSDYPPGVSADAGGIAIGSSGVQINNVYGAGSIAVGGDARGVFVESLQSREQFMSNFLAQALRQADMTFNLSVYFMTLGGIIVLIAAVLAVTRFAGSPSHGVALISGASGILIGASGAAFSRRADKSRKHLAQQASMMQAQIINEQKFSQVIDLLTGVRDPQVNDQARISLAMRLMGEIDKSNETQLESSRIMRNPAGCTTGHSRINVEKPGDTPV